VFIGKVRKAIHEWQMRTSGSHLAHLSWTELESRIRELEEAFNDIYNADWGDREWFPRVDRTKHLRVKPRPRELTRNPQGKYVEWS